MPELNVRSKKLFTTYVCREKQKKMPEDLNINDIIQILGLQQNGPNSEQSLEQLLYNLILNPVKLQRQRIKLDENLGNDVLFELREGSIINEAGCIEEIQELVLNTNTFADGSPKNIYGITKCQTCGSIIREENIRMCPCGRTCCLVPGCGYYSRFTDRWYCSWFHKLLGFLGIGLR